MPDYLSYQKSISAELLSIRNRVRYFIGNHHWGEDGRYKEVILKECIRDKLPSSVNIGTGFVICGGDEITTQIDLIVYRSEIPSLFKKEDFVILPREAVLGIIEVKSKLRSEEINECFRKAHENGLKIGNHIFNGIFSFESGFQLKDHIAPQISTCCKSYHGFINNISFGPDYFMKYWPDGRPYGAGREKYRLYHLIDISFGYFISNLIEDVYYQINPQFLSNELLDFFYPLEGTKEDVRYNPRTIYVDEEGET